MTQRRKGGKRKNTHTKNTHNRVKANKRRGAAATYLTRKQSLRKLQISLRLFRKLCIFKGIFPREPYKTPPAGREKTYFLVKDIKFLAHDPLIQTFRQLHAWKQKYTRARIQDKGKAQSLKLKKPRVNLDHIVKQRYPTFIDAIKDLDDALSMVHLFAVLPITKCIKDQKIFLADLLCKQWQNYIVQKRALRKVFVSIKGIYYQAEVQGQKVTWLAPYTFVQKAPSSIDYQVMKNFLELYSTLLGFVLYKLYTTEGFRYPPVLDHTNYDNTAGLSGLKLENHHKIPRRPKKPNPEEATEEELKDVFHDVQIEKKQKKPKKGLFSSCHFYLTREVPRDSLEFVIRSFGGRISWDGCPWDITESHDSITHQILDRPSQSHIFLSRDYIQPQWVYDSVNAGLLLPVDEYSITSKLPPHLSPFVDDNAEGYVPDRRKKIEEMLASANRVASTKEIEAEKQRMLTQKEDEESGDDDEDDDDFPYFNEEDQEAAEAAERETQYLDELAAEEQGISYSQAQENAGTTTKRPKLTKKEKEDKINQRDRMFSEMMIPSRKKKRLWDKIQKGRQRKENRVQLLTDRKRKIEEDTSAPGASKSKRQKTGDNKANKSNKANKAKRYQPQPAAHLSKKQKTKA